MRVLRVVPVVAVVVALAGLAADPYGDIGGLKILKPQDKVDAKSEPPPAGVEVLFDGKSLDGWVGRNDGKPARWKLVEGGAMQVEKGTGDIMTARKFDGRFRLHVEFRVPYEPGHTGQDAGNSGVYVQGRYEVQVLNSYSLESGKGDCGAIYGVSAPRVNACKAPTVWQKYTIDFTAPRCEDGKKVAPARMTVWHNDVQIQDDVAIPVNFTTAGMDTDPCTPGPILLQDHGHPVQYRNIWIEKK
jgi:hypothetical protein